MRRRLIKALAILVVLAAALAAAGYVYLRQSLPVVAGTVEVPGFTTPVDIVRDADDIPHIFGATKHDVLFGLGYAHAQDRLWQMEFQRRIGFGRLSEVFGRATLPQDRFLRTVGFGRAARTAWDHLPADAREQIGAYVAGVNAFISTHHGRTLPPEFTLLRFEPEPWTGPDVIVWVKMMAWDLSANYAFEMIRHDIGAKVGPERAAELMPPYPADGLTILKSMDLARAVPPSLDIARPFPPSLKLRRTAEAFAEAGQGRLANGGDNTDWSAALATGLGPPDSTVTQFLLNARAEALGSNNWVVDGTKTASGKPMLANDPHLGTHIPSLWYLAHMSARDFDVIGATLPGTPAVAIGRNRFIAWGETNVAADVEDLYRERVTDDGSATEFAGGQEPVRHLTETIVVKGGEPVAVNVRITRHGPLVSDAINANNAAQTTEPKPPSIEPLALRWTALDDEDNTIVAFLHLNEARNWAEFTTSLRQFSVPSQNFVYADVEGHIGYYVPGHIPIRAHGDGSGPADGSTGEAEWTGFIPFDDLPHVYDPPSHFIVTANNRPAPASYPYSITVDYPNPYRAQRITDLIQDRVGMTPDDFRAIQADTFSSQARALLPLLLRHAHPVEPADKAAFDLLKAWNYDARADSAPPAIFQAWFLQLGPMLIADELGDNAIREYKRRFSYGTRFIMSVLDDSVGSGFSRTSAGPQSWCDDVRTPEKETCDDMVTRSLHEAIAVLTRQLGADIPHWRWDNVHHAAFPHQGLDTVPVLHTLLSRSVPNGGDWSTVDVGPVDPEHPFQQLEVPGYRQIIDLSPANDSRFLDAVGQAGHFLSSHYDDFLQDWRNVRHRRMRMDRADIERDSIGHLRLVPTSK